MYSRGEDNSVDFDCLELKEKINKSKTTLALAFRSLNENLICSHMLNRFD